VPAVSLGSQIRKIATEAAQQYAAQYTSISQIQNVASQTQYIGSVAAFAGGTYSVTMPDGSVQQAVPSGDKVPAVGDTVIVINGIILN
jgi:hypothetical protein